MKKILPFLLIMLFLFSCQEKEKPFFFKKYDETAELAAQQNHESKRMQFKLLQSKYLDMNAVFAPFEKELATFTEETYNKLKGLVLEKDIPTLQKSVNEGALSYENLTKFYLYRIRKFESDSSLFLNSIIALNPNVISQAKEKDKNRIAENIGRLPDLSLFGMPILLKDNINTKDMPTTAGAIALAENVNTQDAFIVERLREHGALILGKVNLSEWAYFFCTDCPLGYSAIGGQTLNPYGRKIFETGGSSAGSGVAIAANFAVAAIGTETSGSITSPSSLNSVVGLKPTIGLLSRTGIVPISSTLDTPGPMTKSVIDNYILLHALLGKDIKDAASFEVNPDRYFGDYNKVLKEKKIGILKPLLKDSIYQLTINKLRKAGAEIIEITPSELSFNGFTTLLNIDMKYDLPKYLYNHVDKKVAVRSIEDIIRFNLQDTLLRAPYGQQLFEGIVKDSTTVTELELITYRLASEGRKYLQALDDENLAAILSINNYHSGIAAVAKYPTLTVPMGYKESGEPISLTFIGKPKAEGRLYALAFAFEQLINARKMPKNYQ
jgi:amidase